MAGRENIQAEILVLIESSRIKRGTSTCNAVAYLSNLSLVFQPRPGPPLQLCILPK